jgi:hypothetical protein
MKSTEKLTGKSYQVDQDAFHVIYREHNREVNWSVAEAYFERRLPSHCQLPMTVGYKISSIEVVGALHSAQTASASALELGRYDHA